MRTRTAGSGRESRPLMGLPYDAPQLDPLCRHRRLLHRRDVRSTARAVDRVRRVADRLAAHLAGVAAEAGVDFGYANLAVRGRKLGDVVGPQLDAALAMAPDLVSMVGGGNDILRPSVDLDAIADRLEAAVVRIRATGAAVLLATPTDPAKAGLFRRCDQATRCIRPICSRSRPATGARSSTSGDSTRFQDWRMWADDRIHLTSEGHRRVGRSPPAALGFDTDRADWATPLPRPILLAAARPCPPTCTGAESIWGLGWIGDSTVGRRGRRDGEATDA